MACTLDSQVLMYACWMVQVRAGTGGDEAAIWAADLVRMYQRYAAIQGWKVSFLTASDAELGGFKEAVLQASSPCN